MSYLWKEFNIKTFPAETIVFRNGEYAPELSTIPYAAIDVNYDLPVHVIYIGEIIGEKNLNLDVLTDNQSVFLTVKLKNKKSAFLNIFIKNAGKNSEILSHILIENNGDFTFNCVAEHVSDNTAVLIQTKLLAGKNSKTKLTGTAVIKQDVLETKSDISFSAMAEKSARIEFAPRQRISSAPIAADHSASIYAASAPQITYMRSAGLSGAEVDNVMREAFENSFTLY